MLHFYVKCSLEYLVLIVLTYRDRIKSEENIDKQGSYIVKEIVKRESECFDDI